MSHLTGESLSRHVPMRPKNASSVVLMDLLDERGRPIWLSRWGKAGPSGWLAEGHVAGSRGSVEGTGSVPHEWNSLNHHSSIITGTSLGNLRCGHHLRAAQGGGAAAGQRGQRESSRNLKVRQRREPVESVTR